MSGGGCRPPILSPTSSRPTSASPSNDDDEDAIRGGAGAPPVQNTQFGPLCHNYFPKFGPHSIVPGQLCPNSAELGPMLVELGQRLSRLAKVSPESGPKLGPMSTGVGPISDELGRIRANVGRVQAKFLVNIGQFRANVGRCWTKFAQTGPNPTKLARNWPDAGQHRPISRQMLGGIGRDSGI